MQDAGEGKRGKLLCKKGKASEDSIVENSEPHKPVPLVLALALDQRETS